MTFFLFVPASVLTYRFVTGFHLPSFYSLASSSPAFCKILNAAQHQNLEKGIRLLCQGKQAREKDSILFSQHSTGRKRTSVLALFHKKQGGANAVSTARCSLLTMHSFEQQNIVKLRPKMQHTNDFRTQEQYKQCCCTSKHGMTSNLKH